MTFPPLRTAPANRRMHTRVAVDLPARLRAGATVLEGRIENLSKSGAAFATVTTTPELAAGEPVSLVACGAGDGGADLDVQARVVRSELLCGATGDERSYALVFDRPLDA